ncbi:DUF1461 domain-containing protein [Candidatus Woesearchaeota archaeon]|nr:DUF1461 domain-containing protein [Candidatus Woesearchaeota archaeon]
MEHKYLRLLGIVLVVVSVYLLSFSMVVFHYPIYEKFILQYSADKTTAELQTKNIISYFQGKEELRGFTKPEADHLKDARFVIWLLILVLIFSIIGLFLIKDQKAMVYGGLLSLIIPLILYAIPFELLFNYFHFIFFPQGNWMFDTNSVLIQMYPIDFFYGFFKDIILRGFIFGIVITIVFSMKFLKHKIYFTLQQN